MPEVMAELPILALILQRKLRPINHGLCLRVVDVERNKSASCGNFIPHELGSEVGGHLTAATGQRLRRVLVMHIRTPGEAAGRKTFLRLQLTGARHAGSQLIQKALSFFRATLLARELVINCLESLFAPKVFTNGHVLHLRRHHTALGI